MFGTYLGQIMPNISQTLLKIFQKKENTYCSVLNGSCRIPVLMPAGSTICPTRDFYEETLYSLKKVYFVSPPHTVYVPTNIHT